MSHHHDHHHDLTAEERRAALLTAHALGQLDAADRAEAERILAFDTASAEHRLVAETARLAAALTAARNDDLPPRSADLRRAVLAAAAAQPARSVTTGAGVPGGRDRRVIRWLASVGAIAAAVVVAVGIVPMLRRPAVEVARLETRHDHAKEKPQAENTVTDVAAEPAQPSVAVRPKPAETVAPSASPTGLAADAEHAPHELGEAAAAEESLDSEMAVTGVVSGNSIGLGGRAQASKMAARGGGKALPATGLGDLGLATDVTGASPPMPGQALGSNSWAVAPQPGGGQTDCFGGPGLNGVEKQSSGERYNHFTENAFLRPSERPLSTFSIDVDTASYANVRRFLMAGQRPPRDAVRLEELLNYFRYTDPAPTGNVPFSVTVEAATCPWRPGHRIVRVGLKGRDVARDRRPAGNLVFLVDVSGSMGDADKLPLVKQALTMLVDELTENDRVAIVTYAGEAGLRLPSTRGDQKTQLRVAIDSLSSGGSTHGSAGIELAYEQAAEHFIPGGANRVILATDGDLNVGITDDAALVDLITKKAKGGTFLTVLGFGQGNLQDEKMEKLADKGNGVYAYIDGVREARKVLVEQLTGSTLTIAKDVKIQVEFNPARVASYRLLGYENRALADKDFRDDTKDAGEIGAGHGVTTLYEIEVVGEADDRAPAGAEPLKYQPEPATKPATPADANASRELLTVKLRYKEPEGTTSKLLEVPLGHDPTAFGDASSDLRFAAAVAAFGMLLRESAHAGEATFPMVAKIAAAALGGDDGGYRAEFLDLVRRAEATR